MNLTEQYIIKSRSGVYQDTSENRRKHRVGQHYGEAKKEGEEGKSSKREQREVRLASYKKNLATISEAIKEGKIDPSKKEAAETLKAKLEGKITKLEARLNKKGQQKTEEPKPEAKKKPWANKGVGMPKSDGKKLFEGLTKEQQKALTDKYKEESESMLRQENMTPELVIGAIEEFIGENLYESDDVMDLAEELKVSKNEAQAIIRHTLDLEMKRLEGLEKEAGKVSDEKQKLSDRVDAIDKEMKKLDNQILLNGGSVRKTLEDAKKKLQSERDDLKQRMASMSGSKEKTAGTPNGVVLPKRGQNITIKMGKGVVTIKNTTEYSSNEKDIYVVTASKDGKPLETISTAVPKTIDTFIEKYGSGSKEISSDIFDLKSKVATAKNKWMEIYKKSPYGSVKAQEAFMKYEKLQKQLEQVEKTEQEKDFEAFAEKFEKNYRRDPNRTVPTKSSEIRELARKEWEKMKS